MLKTVIIDDDESFCNTFKMNIENYISKITVDYSIDIILYDFVNSINKTNYDIIFLDIDLESINGINLSHLILKTCKSKPLIIFVSSRSDLVFDSLSAQPFHFIRKSNLKNDLPITFNLLKKYFQKNSSLLTFQYKGRKTSIKCCDILYIESDFHDIFITTQTDEYVYRSTLKAILETLNSKRFVRIQKSLIINLDFVQEIDEKNNVILTTGNVFSINRHYKKQALKEFQEYLLLC